MNTLEKFRLDGKVALVTGANRGLGQSIAVGLAEVGADVALLARSGSCPETVQMVEVLGKCACVVACDLSVATISNLNAVVQQVVQRLGRLDILVNNAGVIRRAAALEFSEEDWDTVLQVNLKSAFFLAQAAAKVMKDQGGGKIINIASMLSFQGGILVPSYTAAKSAIMGLTRALANEWSRFNINVNAIAPGYMATDNTAALRADPARREAILARIPAGRWGEADDLKGAAVFLASAASDYVHGATLPVDGGWLAR